MPMPRSIRYPRTVLVAGLLLAGCHEAPTFPTDGPSLTLVVSNPVTLRTAMAGSLGSRHAVAADLASTEPLAYVSLLPGTVPGGTTATITDLRTGTSLQPLMIDGGFDPVAIPAAAGDTLAISVALQTGGLRVSLAKSVVPASRPPRVVRTSPGKGQTDVALNASIAVIFSEPVDPATVTPTTVRLLKDGQPLAGTVRPLAGSPVGIEFVPANPLSAATVYELVLSQQIADLTGDRLEAQATAGFTTAATGVIPASGDLAFTVQPSEVFSRAVMFPHLQVTVRDATGAIDLTSTDTVTVSLGNNPGNASLTGWTSAVVEHGVANFGGTAVSSPASGYTLTARAGARTGTSGAFNVLANPWQPKSLPSTFRYYPAATAVNGVLYLIGGLGTDDWVTLDLTYATVEAYDPATNLWRIRAPMPTPRGQLGIGVVDGIIYAVGGSTEAGVALATVEAYDPATDTWTTRAPLATARAGLGVGVVNGKIVAVGGDNNRGTVEVYDPATDTWSPGAPMPTPRWGSAVAVVNDVLYTVGGYYTPSGSTTATPIVESYDPAVNTWTSRTAAPTALGESGAAALNGKLYVVGGRSYFGSESANDGAVDVFDPATDRWESAAPLPLGDYRVATAVVDGVIYAYGFDEMNAYRP